MLANVAVLYSAAGCRVPLLYGRRMEEVLLRRRLVLLVATVMKLVMAASPAWAVPGNGQGAGLGQAGGDTVNVDNGQKTRVGGGPLNDPHNGCVFC
jgi:hypothetical protein